MRHGTRPHPAAALALAALALALASCGEVPEEPVLSPVATYPVRQVFVRWDPAARNGSPDGDADPKKKAWQGRTRAAALLQALELTRRARATGADFEAIARETSDDEDTREDGGFVGFVSLRQGAPPVLLDAAAALKPGEVTEPIESGTGWHVLQLLSREEGKAVEARLVAVLLGYVIPWNEIQPSLDPAVTRQVAYVSAVSLVGDVRGGLVPDTVASKIAGQRPLRESFRRTSRGAAELWQAAIKWQPGGEYGDPVETAQGWVVARRLPYFRCHVRHLVVAHRGSAIKGAKPERSRDEARARAVQALSRVLADPSRWDDVVREFSDEAASSGTGGFMGDVSNADLLDRPAPEFLDALAALAPGAVSDHIVETRFGFHVFRRVD